MIIFDLDGTLADCEHRRHFVDPKYLDTAIWKLKSRLGGGYDAYSFTDGTKWQPDWKSFYEACDKDKPIYPTLELAETLVTHDEYEQLPLCEVEIWSGRCESVRKKTERWLDKHLNNYTRVKLKMRPRGDNTPDDVLKEIWYNDMLTRCQYQSVNNGTAVKMSRPVEMVFTANVKEVAMWRRRGIFVFNCAQHDEEF